MNIDELTLGQIKQIQSLFPAVSKTEVNPLESFGIGQYCIIRTYSAGVFFGIPKHRNGMELIVENCQRIWSWEGAFTLSKISTDGFKAAKMSVVEPIKLVTQVIEIIPCSENSIKIIKETKIHG